MQLTIHIHIIYIQTHTPFQSFPLIHILTLTLTFILIKTLTLTIILTPTLTYTPNL